MDEQLLLWINQGWAHPASDALFWWVSSRIWFAYPLIILLLYDTNRHYGQARGWLRLWLWLVLTVTFSDMLGNVLKELFAEPRPCQTVFDQLRTFHGVLSAPCGFAPNGMPSSHTMNFFAAATFIARATPWRRWQMGLFIVAVLVGLSRVYLGKHYPSQVLVGAGIGILIGWLGAWCAAFCHTLLFGQSVEPVTSRNPSALPAPASIRDFSEDLAMLPPHRLSVIVPLYNELDNVTPLLADIHQALATYPFAWELIVVDDGSSDGTTERLLEEAARYGSHVRVLALQRNFGQTAAMQAGIDAARGEVIATLDGDLQNDPADIPRLVARLLQENLDLVVGWRRHRQDNVWLRTIPSHLANVLIGNITGVRLHDYGCSLKAYRADVIKQVRLYGEMHRFIPAWMSVRTAPSRIREEIVNHRPRVHGESKYGISRTFRVVLDLLVVYFFLRFLTKPGHFFGRIGLASGGVGLLILLYLFGQKVLFAAHIGTRPLLLVGVLLVLMAVQFLTTGVLSELITRTYLATSANSSYAIRADSEPGLAPEAGWRTSHG